MLGNTGIWLWGLCALFCLPGCYRWEADDKPVSGVKLLTQGTDFVLQQDGAFAFGGSVVGLQADSLAVGVVFRPVGFEAFGGSPLAFYQRIEKRRLTSAVATVADTLVIPQDAPAGRYQFFSVVSDRLGNRSDTNATLARVRADFYPFAYNTTPALAETATRASPGDSVQLTFTADAGVGPAGGAIDSVYYRICTVLGQGSLACQTQRVLAGDSIPANTFRIARRAKIEIPLNAVPGQRFRAQIVVVNAAGYRYTWQPLYEIRS